MQKPKPKPKKEPEVKKVHILSNAPLDRIIRFNSDKPVAQEFAEFGALYHRHRKPKQHLILVWAEYDFEEIQAYMESFNEAPEIEGPEDEPAEEQAETEEEAQVESEAEDEDDFDEEELDF